MKRVVRDFLYTWFLGKLTRLENKFECPYCCQEFSGLWLHFKCLKCEDMIICHKCYTSGKHDQHYVKKRGEIHKKCKFISCFLYLFASRDSNINKETDLILYIHIKRASTIFIFLHRQTNYLGMGWNWKYLRGHVSHWRRTWQKLQKFLGFMPNSHWSCNSKE